MTRQDRLRKWFSYALTLLPVWWLDAYILSRWPVFGVTPVLLPVAVTAVSVLEGVSGGAGFGFGAGLLWAAYPGGHGSRVLVLTVMGMLTGALAQYALAQTLMGVSDDKLAETVEQWDALFRTLVQEAVENRLKGSTPSQGVMQDVSLLPDADYYAQIYPHLV